MTRYLLLALNGPTPDGDEEAYNEWYDKVHIPDLESLNGVRSARRFKVIDGNGTNHPYLAAYEIVTDDLQAVMNDMTNNIRPFDSNFDRSVSQFIMAQALHDDA